MRVSHCPIVAVALTAILGTPTVAPAQQQIRIETTVAPGGEPMMIPGLTPGPMKTGTGRIAGRVVSSDTGAPLRRAQVRISAPEIGAKTALTDSEGRYEFKELPAGRFTVNVSKSGYVPVQYGQSRPFESGRPIELSDKHYLYDADISMPRGGVISGRILDEFGEPVADAMVTTMRQTWANGRRRLLPGGRQAQTNDLGQFRLYGLPPGEYYVSATLRNLEPVLLEAAMARLGGSAASASEPSSGYAPTYFPGTPTASNAQRVTVAVGQESQNTDFALIPVRLARISGAVMTSDGKPLEGAMVTVMPLGRSGEIGLGFMGSAGRTSKDGAFAISNVAPGDHTLNVRSVRIITSDAGDTMTFRATIGGPDGSNESESASLPISVGGEDLTNVMIVTSKGATAIGRLTFEGTSTPPATVTGVRISAMPTDMEGPVMMSGGGPVKADGSFELKGLSGRRLIRAANLPQGWALKAVRLNGEDITDAGADFRPGQEVSGLEIVATNKQTQIVGGVTASNGSTIKDYTVVAFSEDPQQWTLPMTRWVTGTRPDQEGRFRIRNLPAGNYLVVALEYVEQGAWADPELLDRLKSRAKRISLRDGQTETVDLKITELQ